MKKTKSLKARLVLALLGLGILPMMATGFVSYQLAVRGFSANAYEAAKVVDETHAHDIEMYFKENQLFLLDKADSVGTREAAKEFIESFHAIQETLKTGKVPGFDPVEAKKAVLDYYKNQFGKTYQDKNAGKSFDVDSVVDKLPPIVLFQQYDFIAKNPHPLGSKHLMFSPDRKTLYSAVHEKYHPEFKTALERHGLYDIFIVDEQGNVVYTVFKELDYATNLANGPWAETGLSEVWKKAQGLKPGETYITDFALYPPSYEAPASFISTKIFDGEKPVATLIFQMPLDQITKVAHERAGLGEKGEFLIFGKDGRLRVDSFRNGKTHTVAASFSTLSPEALVSPSQQKLLKGEAGQELNVSYDGLETLALFRPVKILNLEWYFLTELAQDEVFAYANKLTMWVLGILGASVLLITGVSLWLGAGMSRRLSMIADLINASSTIVASNAVQSASAATELSESVTEQASSLQETMASLEQISAMVNQNAESSQKAKSSVEANEQAAQNGVKTMHEMIQAIGEIKGTNTNILQQMEESNREFNEIVRIISEIGDKTKVINEIVLQTKLLSFNASVEAARAGEHGKGFAVVAEEVGNLAQMSGNAANQISGMLSDSVKRVNDIVDRTTRKIDQLVEVGQDKVSMGEETAKRAREVLEKISENARTVSAMVTEIAHASTEQAQGIAEINRAITQMDSVTQQNSAVSRQSSGLAESLQGEADSLVKAVGELNGFIHGAKAVLSPTVPVEKTEGAQVISLSDRAPKPAEKKPVRQEKTLKVAANGAPSVPSSEDPNFEEF